MAMALHGCTFLVRRSDVRSRPAADLNEDEQALLRILVDELIPAADGMPAAGAVGALDYLQQLARSDVEVRSALESALARLETLSRDTLASPFALLSPPQRLSVLSQMEQRDSHEFAILRDFTYEAYYTRPQVWQLIGYDGNSMRDERWNDDALLGPVRAMPRLDRAVS
jgi:hypothetical protein